MNKKNTTIIFAMILVLIAGLKLASAVTVDANYLTIYPGEQGKITLRINNNEDFNMKSITASIALDNLPFTSVGSSEQDVDDIDKDDYDSASFTIKASEGITPGDYQIPYIITYTNSKTDVVLKKIGSFGIRVSAQTQLDYVVQVTGNAIEGQQGKVSLEIINRGLGGIKSSSVQIYPQGFDLLSPDKVFIGTINADDTDSATFDVLYSSTTPILKAKISYKDFDNNDQSETVSLPFKVYTKEEALKLGLISNSNAGLYLGIIIVLLIIWFFWRRSRKKKKNKGG
jgi:hypothetical protein